MGIFYNPPPPPTANNAGTPPEPHVPIGTQGTSVPPRRAVMFAATMAVLVATWPADLEPRLTRPNDQQTKIAPLTRVYGAQPSPCPALALAELTPIVASWQETWTAQRAPTSLAWLAPLSPYLAHTPLPSLIWTAWEQPPLPPPRPVAIAPLTLAYGQQPAPQPPLSALELAHIVGTWAQPWAAQTAPESAAWDVPVVVSAFVPFARPRYDILASHQDPVTVLLVQAFVVGQSSTDDPPRQSALSLANQAIALAWAPAAVAPPAQRSTAAWNVPPVVQGFVPFVRLRSDILAEWARLDMRRSERGSAVPMTRFKAFWALGSTVVIRAGRSTT